MNELLLIPLMFLLSPLLVGGARIVYDLVKICSRFAGKAKEWVGKPRVLQKDLRIAELPGMTA